MLPWFGWQQLPFAHRHWLLVDVLDAWSVVQRPSVADIEWLGWVSDGAVVHALLQFSWGFLAQSYDCDLRHISRSEIMVSDIGSMSPSEMYDPPISRYAWMTDESSSHTGQWMTMSRASGLN